MHLSSVLPCTHCLTVLCAQAAINRLIPYVLTCITTLWVISNVDNHIVSHWLTWFGMFGVANALVALAQVRLRYVLRPARPTVHFLSSLFLITST